MMILRKEGFYFCATTLIFQDDKIDIMYNSVMNALIYDALEHVLKGQGIRCVHLNGWVLP